MQGDTRAELRFEIEDLLSVAMLGLAELSVGNDVEAVHFQFVLRDKCDYSSRDSRITLSCAFFFGDRLDSSVII